MRSLAIVLTVTVYLSIIFVVAGKVAQIAHEINLNIIKQTADLEKYENR